MSEPHCKLFQDVFLPDSHHLYPKCGHCFGGEAVEFRKFYGPDPHDKSGVTFISLDWNTHFLRQYDDLIVIN